MTIIFILILAIPAFFISRWVLKRLDIGTNKNRNYIAVFPALIISPFLYISIMLLWFASSTYYPTHQFSKFHWETNIEERYTMSKDIIESNMLIGKTKEEISGLLGTGFYVYNDNHIGYNLGFTPGLFNIDPDVLDIYFENGKVVKVEQHES
ncbi:hypothetical protein [Formosa sp. PL04]|uniref:hypothetical protein n=1 Tax=Formosa sp. PL04 TaxID=3081755 RepID=UPI00298213E3|nr:hypothetical protein [Formosa sp. PL04]MDW5289763.1 hypothetical protein [Formosa sp. PL04]